MLGVSVFVDSEVMSNAMAYFYSINEDYPDTRKGVASFSASFVHMVEASAFLNDLIY